MDFSIIAKIARDLVRIDRLDLPQADILTVAHDNDRSFFYEGKWYSPLMDTIEDDLRAQGATCVSVARVISRIKGELAYADVYSPEGAFARALVSKRIIGLLRPNRYAYSVAEERVWQEIIGKTGARKVLAIQPSRELCTACRKSGVWVADVQHGVISETHPWYGEKFRGSDPLEWLPNAFLVWDKGSSQVIDAWANGRDVATVITGNRWLVRFVQQLPNDRLVSTNLSKYASLCPKSDPRPTVLVSFSWGEINIPNGFMVDELIDAIHRTSTIFRWLVRLHPNQLNGFATHEGRQFTEFFKNHLEGHVEWELPTRSPLPVVLQHTDLHIAWNSSVVIEAGQMGIRSALLDPRLRDPGQVGTNDKYYQSLGVVDFIDPGMTVDWLKRNKFSKKVPDSMVDFNNNYANFLHSAFNTNSN